MFDSDANPNKGLPNYTSCANIKIQGGAPVSENPGKCAFTWAGGDKEYTRVNKGAHAQDTCVYFIKNTVGRAQDTVKINPNFIKVNGRPAEVEECLKSGGVGRQPATQQQTTPANNNNQAPSNSNNNVSPSIQCSKTIEVNKGESCLKIAENNGLGMPALNILNPNLKCGALKAGDKLCVAATISGGAPANTNNNNNNSNSNTNTNNNTEEKKKEGCQNQYHSQKGDDCESISSKFGITIERFQKMNNWVNCKDIWLNTKVCVDKP
jgi:LysM repeat protein